ncbi:restriction system modified-DNA reader domain-containing protein [Pedobacter kyonggii]|uniref:RAMA domain-containing protein n=1 Tax=Pedobacter kyonggii TaxID=1926871 RepID=A0A4Q9HCZ4_9SPHI|nr:hypothetical protein [Pedobacter kyonggii]TBO42253.1 hypothetical protein EYS08_12065 [Pedobacter kyonggii]
MSNIELTEVTLKMILDAGILKPGTRLFASTHPNVNALLTGDGKINIDFDGQIRTFDFLSGAARSLTNLSLNGWKFWSVEIDNEWKEVSYLRELFIKAHTSF